MKTLISVNVEGDRHLDRVRPFLKEHSPDVICLQEVFFADTEALVGSEYHREFLPMCLKARADGSLSPWGIAIATRDSTQHVIHEYYHQPNTTLVIADDSSLLGKRRSYRHGLLGVTMSDVSGDITLFTTHLTWTPDGLTNESQTADMHRMLHYLESQAPHILCGDFNLPRRQNTLYPIISARYTDHIPPHYETSMYIPLHRVKDIPEVAAKVGAYMVDYIFSTPGEYEVRDVSLKGDISDHYALLGTIEKSL